MGNEGITFMSGTIPEYKKFNPKYAYYNEHIKECIKQHKEYCNFYGISGNMDPNSKYYNDECDQYKTENDTDMTIYDRKNDVHDFLKLEPQNEKKLHINIQKFKKLMNNRDFFDKNFISIDKFVVIWTK